MTSPQRKTVIKRAFPGELSKASGPGVREFEEVGCDMVRPSVSYPSLRIIVTAAMIIAETASGEMGMIVLRI
jgi:hypothetical protein